MCISYASEQLKNIHLPHRTTKTFRDMIYKKKHTQKKCMEKLHSVQSQMENKLKWVTDNSNSTSYNVNMNVYTI